MPMHSRMIVALIGGVALTMMGVLGAHAQALSGDQQKCLNAMNKAGAVLSRTTGQNSMLCLKIAARDALDGTAQECVSDAGGLKYKISNARFKVFVADVMSCDPPLPPFGYTGSTNVGDATRLGEVYLTADVFGPDLDAAVIGCASNKAGCACQQKVQKAVEKLAALEFATFVQCKNAALAAGADAAEALEDCVDDAGTAGSIAADSKGKIAKVSGAIASTVAKSCDTPGVTVSAFPGACAGLTGESLGTCLATRVRCRICQIIDAADGLSVDCDTFDNGVADLTCN